MASATDPTVSTVRGLPPSVPVGPAPTEEMLPDGQHADHWVLSEAQRTKGYVRPVRRKYRHLKCGAVTSMPELCAETWARDITFYTHTFCMACREYFPVDQFTWDDSEGKPLGS